jgi:hypothetical protein
MQHVKLIVVGCALVALSATTVQAAPRKARDGQLVGYAVAESRNSGKVIAAPVRRSAATGRLEFRMKNGTWIECGRSCNDTLRRTTVDFWDSKDPGGGGSNGPGYLRYRF